MKTRSHIRLKKRILSHRTGASANQSPQQMLQSFEIFRHKATKIAECQGIIAGTVASGESSLSSVILLAVNGCFNL
jgi:hypothetical protein